MRVYIAGPMRGYPQDNHAEFDRIEKLWKDAGHNPVSPAYMARALGKERKEGEFDSTPKSMREVMIIDTVVICGCDGIALMKGWQKSKGATMELALAHSIGISVYDAETMQRLIIPHAPWSQLVEKIPMQITVDVGDK